MGDWAPHGTILAATAAITTSGCFGNKLEESVAGGPELSSPRAWCHGVLGRIGRWEHLCGPMGHTHVPRHRQRHTHLSAVYRFARIVR